MDPWFDRLDSRLGHLDMWDNDEFFVPTSRYSRMYRPRVRTWVHSAAERDQAPSGEGTNKDLFSVKLDVHQFHPDEVTVKTKDNSLIIEAKHEEREDSHGFIARHFVRRYIMPDDVKVDQLACNMSSDGILELCAPRKLMGGETVVPIRHTGRPAKIITPTASTAGGAAPTSPVPPTTASSGTAPSSGHQSRGQTIPIEREGGNTASSTSQ